MEISDRFLKRKGQEVFISLTYPNIILTQAVDGDEDALLIVEHVSFIQQRIKELDNDIDKLQLETDKYFINSLEEVRKQGIIVGLLGKLAPKEK